jgi:DNA-binding GntR family transcriptional regulator
MSGAATKAYEEIRKRLLTGEYAPGEKLSEQELSDRIGVSRTPVREALRLLAAECFVEIEPNVGASVMDWGREDIDDIFEIRAMLEGYAARKAALNASPAHVDELKRIVAEIDAALGKGARPPVATFLRLNSAFHEKLRQASGNSRLAEIIGRFTEQAVVHRTARQYSGDDMRRSNALHRDIVSAVEGRNGALAETLMRAHILAAAAVYRGSFSAVRTK